MTDVSVGVAGKGCELPNMTVGDVALRKEKPVRWPPGCSLSAGLPASHCIAKPSFTPPPVARCVHAAGLVVVVGCVAIKSCLYVQANQNVPIAVVRMSVNVVLYCHTAARMAQLRWSLIGLCWRGFPNAVWACCSIWRRRQHPQRRFGLLGWCLFSKRVGVLSVMVLSILNYWEWVEIYSIGTGFRIGAWCG